MATDDKDKSSSATSENKTGKPNIPAQESASSEKKAENRVVKRDDKGKLIGGVLNPGGRPKGLASYVRELTDDNREQARFFWRLSRGELKGYKPEHVMEANKWLADRGSGKSIDVQAIANLTPEAVQDAYHEIANETLLAFARSVEPLKLPETSKEIEDAEFITDGQDNN